MPTKSALQSKTVWGAAIAGLAALLNFFGINIGDFTPQLTDQIYNVVGLVGTLVAIYGRITASKLIAPKLNSSTTMYPLAALLAFGAMATGAIALQSCSDTSGVSPTFTSSTVGKVGLDLNTAAQQALADYAHVKTNGVDYVWALSEAFNAYATIAKTRGDVENLVAQWGGSSSSTTADRIADLFGASSGSTRDRMLTLAQAALDTATNLTKPKTSSIWMSRRPQSLAFAREDMRRGIDKGDQRRGKLDKGDQRRGPLSVVLRWFGLGA